MEEYRIPEGNLIAREDCVVVLIDLQEKLIPVITGKEGVLENALRLLRFTRIARIPVIITEQEKLGKTVAEVAGEAGGLEPIQKIEFNCFMSDGFRYRIKELGRKTLILAGVEAHICVAQTALCGAQSFRIHVVADAVGSRVLFNRDIALRRMEQHGATLTTTEMFIYEVLKQAGTEEFKETLSVVK